MQKPRIHVLHVKLDAGFVRRSSANARPSIAALQTPTFVFAQASPYAMILARFECPREALFADVAASAHDLGFFDLKDGRARIANGEEEFWVFIETR